MGKLPRLPFEWRSIEDITLADAILVYAKERLQSRFAIWIEDLTVAFATTPVAAIKGAVTELRERGLFRAANEHRLQKFANGIFRDWDRSWASGITRDGIRLAATLRERDDFNKLLKVSSFDTLEVMFEQIDSRSEIEEFLRAIPDGLRELEQAHRYKNRDGFDITDEYDLQDFVRAFLKMRFPRSIFEDPVSKVAGRSGRVDFVLKDQRILIELKVFADESHWRSTMVKDIASKIDTYGRSQDCDILFIFVYDQHRRFREALNAEEQFSVPRSINKKEFDVRLIVAPK